MGIMKRRKRAAELRAGVVMHADPTPEMVRVHAESMAATAAPKRAKRVRAAKAKVK